MALKIEKRMAWAFSRRAAAGAQLTLELGEVHRLNPVPPGIRVLSGVAWIAWRGEDIVLDEGQEIRFSPGGDDPVISALGWRALVVEMLQGKHGGTNMMDEAVVSQWLGNYVSAWKSYDPHAIGSLFSEDALYYYGPFGEPLRGRQAIVADWLKNRDESGTYDAQYRPIAIQGNLAVTNGRSLYYEKGASTLLREYDNLFVIRFNDAGECTEFREWFMQKKTN